MKKKVNDLQEIADEVVQLLMRRCEPPMPKTDYKWVMEEVISQLEPAIEAVEQEIGEEDEEEE